jgi:hypothetical protein
MAQRRDLDFAAEIIRDWALARYPDLRPERLKVELVGRGGIIEEVRLPIPPMAAQERRTVQRSCRADILRIIEDAGHRMSTQDILAELVHRDIEWSERKVSGELSSLVADGALTNPKVNNRSMGYGLPEWPNE